MAWGLFRNRFHSKAAPVRYAEGDLFDPGAQRLVFERTYADAVVSVLGAGDNAGMLEVMQPPMVWQNLTLPFEPLQGTPAGMLYNAPPVDESGIGAGAYGAATQPQTQGATNG